MRSRQCVVLLGALTCIACGPTRTDDPAGGDNSSDAGAPDGGCGRATSADAIVLGTAPACLDGQSGLLMRVTLPDPTKLAPGTDYDNLYVDVVDDAGHEISKNQTIDSHVPATFDVVALLADGATQFETIQIALRSQTTVVKSMILRNEVPGPGTLKEIEIDLLAP